MSRTLKTEGIILARTNFGEADRILTFLTVDHGKLKAIAKSVRKSQSKLAGGMELFCISYISVVVGRGEINTLISTRLKKYYGRIVKDLERTRLAYEALSLINKNTEDAADNSYFKLLQSMLTALNEPELDARLTKLWFDMQLLKLSGHAPNLHHDIEGKKLLASSSYDFKHERMYFVPKPAKSGLYDSNDIKFLRIALSSSSPCPLQRVQSSEKLIQPTQALAQTMLQTYLRV